MGYPIDYKKLNSVGNKFNFGFFTEFSNWIYLFSIIKKFIVTGENFLILTKCKIITIYMNIKFLSNK